MKKYTDTHTPSPAIEHTGLQNSPNVGWGPVILIGIGTIVRFLIWRVKFLDIDEAFQLFIVSRSTLKDLFHAVESLGPQQFPVDYLIDFWVARWTLDIHALRMIPLLWSIGSIVTIYFIAKRILGHEFGKLWILLIGLSTLHIEYSVTLRSYALIVFLSTLSVYAFLKIYLDASHLWLLIYPVISFIYGMTYPFSLVKNVIDLGFFTFGACKVKRKALLAWGVGFLFPAVFSLGKFVGMRRADVFGFDSSAVFGARVIYNVLLKFGQNTLYTGLLYFVLVIIGLFKMLRSEEKNIFLYLFSVLIGTFIVIIASLEISHLFFQPRHAIALLPFYLGFVALGIHALISKTNIPIYVPLIAIGLFSVLPIKKAIQSEIRINGNLKSIASFFQEEMKSGDVIVFGDPNFGAILLHYIDKRAFFGLNGIQLTNSLDIFSFPRSLVVRVGSATCPVVTRCSIDSSLETVDQQGIVGLVHASSQARTSVWFPYLPFRYAPTNDLNDMLKIPNINLIERKFGVFRCVERGFGSQ